MNTAIEIDLVVDTNIIVSQLAGDPDRASEYAPYQRHIDQRSLAISFQTVAELAVQRAIQAWDTAELEDVLSEIYMVEHSPELSECYRRVRTAAIRRNRRGEEPLVGPADGWIAAAALLLDVPLVTHDRRLARSPLITTTTELPDAK